MKTGRLLGIVGIGIALGAGVAWRSFCTTRITESLWQTAVKKRSDAEVAIRGLEEQIAALEKERIQLWSTRGVTPHAVVSRDAKDRPVVILSDNNRLDKDPELQNLYLASERASLTASYGPFFHRLKLTPAQIDRFEENAIKQSETRMDISALARRGVIPSNGQEAGQAFGAAQSVYQEAQRDLLGEEGARELAEYERTLIVRNFVGEFAGAAALAGSAINPQQAEQLTQIVANADLNYQNGKGARMQNLDWSLVDTQARLFLNEPQLDLLKSIELPNGSAGYGRFSARLQATIAQARAADNASLGSNKPAAQ